MPRYYSPPPQYPYGKKKRPPWVYKWRAAAAQILLPIICFQLLRLLFFATFIDVLILIILACAFWYFQK
ncbi:hypothetical protein ACE1TF_00200 [Geomicrobium sp. JSM 1781026]|uniref:hypothetical protein n=1 Tax=unclassified Geomicrobium TaxID=2628951 RepID=UPI0005A8D70A|nr:MULTISPECIES: hypothetical protein [unclassified Geomicrobium]